MAQEALDQYELLYKKYWLAGMRAKLGLFNTHEDDETLVVELLNLMEQYQVDYTNTFRALTLGETNSGKLFCSREFAAWRKLWQKRLQQQRETAEEVLSLMKRSNPAVIPRNYLVEALLRLWKGGLQRHEELFKPGAPLPIQRNGKYAAPSTFRSPALDILRHLKFGHLWCLFFENKIKLQSHVTAARQGSLIIYNINCLKLLVFLLPFLANSLRRCDVSEQSFLADNSGNAGWQSVAKPTVPLIRLFISILKEGLRSGWTRRPDR